MELKRVGALKLSSSSPTADFVRRLGRATTTFFFGSIRRHACTTSMKNVRFDGSVQEKRFNKSTFFFWR